MYVGSQQLHAMATNVQLKSEYENKIDEINETLPVDASNAEIVRQSIDLMHEEVVDSN